MSRWSKPRLQIVKHEESAVNESFWDPIRRNQIHCVKLLLEIGLVEPSKCNNENAFMELNHMSFQKQGKS